MHFLYLETSNSYRTVNASVSNVPMWKPLRIYAGYYNVNE